MPTGHRLTEKDYHKIAQKFGIKFIGPFPLRSTYYTNWQCNCGNLFKRPYSYILDQSFKCSICSPRHQKGIYGKSHSNWKGHEEIPGVILSRIKRQSLERELEFDLTPEYIYQLFLNQNKKCSLSGLELKFNSQATTKDGNASLDRIDSSKGYVEGNVQWVHKDINLMKNYFNEDYFIKMCCLIVDKSRGII